MCRYIPSTFAANAKTMDDSLSVQSTSPTWNLLRNNDTKRPAMDTNMIEYGLPNPIALP